MVGGVEARTLEDDSNRGHDLFERFLPAFRASLERSVAEGLLTFELDSARFATIGVNWHFFFFTFPMSGGIIARAGGYGKS